MAENSKAKSTKGKQQVKPAQTVREQATKASQSSAKPRRVRRTRGALGMVFAPIGRVFTKILRPFSFILWPFKTRPARFIGRILAVILLINFMRGAWQELREVQWPDRKQTTQLTFAVFIFAIIFGIIIAVTDYALDKIFKVILLR